jgi:hypothetical protein
MQGMLKFSNASVQNSIQSEKLFRMFFCKTATAAAAFSNFGNLKEIVNSSVIPGKVVESGKVRKYFNELNDSCE